METKVSPVIDINITFNTNSELSRGEVKLLITVSKCSIKMNP
jgi:hypothetical protein